MYSCWCVEASELKVLCFGCQILPGVRVIIVNPETRGPLGDSHLGEVSGQKNALKSFYICFVIVFILITIISIC